MERPELPLHMTAVVLVAGAVSSFFLALAFMFYANAYDGGAAVMFAAWVFLLAAPVSFVVVLRLGGRLLRNCRGGCGMPRARP